MSRRIRRITGAAASLLAVASFGDRAVAQSILWEEFSSPDDLSAIEDFDGDGRADVLWLLVIVGSNGSQTAYVSSGPDGAYLYHRDPGKGAFIAPAGDLDGDGVTDVLVADPKFKNASGTEVGRVTGISGVDGSILFYDEGDWSSSSVHDNRLGVALARIGDVDGDGRPDFAYAVESASTGFGVASSRIEIVESGGTTRTTSLGNSQQVTFDRWSEPLVGLGDVNGDGRDDFAIGSYASGWPYVDVISGKDLTVLYTLASAAGDDRFGSALARVGDLDGDGVSELLIGARDSDDAGAGAGSVHVVSGATGAQLTVLDGETGAAFGTSVCGLGDVDRDGIDDFAVGSPFDDWGGIGIFSGATFQELEHVENRNGGYDCGWKVVGPGDLDGDGHGDLVVADDQGFTAWTLALEPTIRYVNPSAQNYKYSWTTEVEGGSFRWGGPMSVTIGGQAASNVTVVDYRRLTCDPPPGLQNGPYDVVVSNSWGSAALTGGLIVTPATLASGSYQPGGFVDLSIRIEEGDSLMVIGGVPPPVSIPTPPYDGTLQILPFQVLFLGGPIWNTSQEFHFDLPNDPTLSGLTVLVQALDGPKLGGKGKDACWTNHAVIAIQ